MKPTSELAIPESHVRFVEAARRERLGRAAAALALREVRETGIYKDLNYSSIYHYAENVAGWGRKKVKDLLMIARRLDTLPAIRAAVVEGRARRWTHVREVVRLATPESDAEWAALLESGSLGSRELEERVALEKGRLARAALAGEPTPPGVDPDVVRDALAIKRKLAFTTSQYALVDEAQGLLARELGVGLSLTQAIALMARAVIDGLRPAARTLEIGDERVAGFPRARVQPFRVLVLGGGCCDDVWHETASGPVPASPAFLSELDCSGEVEDVREALGPRPATNGRSAASAGTTKAASPPIRPTGTAPPARSATSASKGAEKTATPATSAGAAKRARLATSPATKPASSAPSTAATKTAKPGGTAQPPAWPATSPPRATLQPLGGDGVVQPFAPGGATPLGELGRRPARRWTRRRPLPGRVRRALAARDRLGCAVPGCRNRIWRECHHIIYLSRGGAEHDPENIIELCTGHHVLVHDGVMRIEGTASAPRFLVRIGRGRWVTMDVIETLEGLPTTSSERHGGQPHGCSGLHVEPSTATTLARPGSVAAPESRVLALLREGGALHLDTIQERLGLSENELLGAVLALEMRSQIVERFGHYSVPGGGSSQPPEASAPDPAVPPRARTALEDRVLALLLEAGPLVLDDINGRLGFPPASDKALGALMWLLIDGHIVESGPYYARRDERTVRLRNGTLVFARLLEEDH